MAIVGRDTTVEFPSSLQPGLGRLEEIAVIFETRTPHMTTPLHIALLGDSIFDNARYVSGGLAVTDHLRRALPRDSVTLLATDGDITRDVFGQLQRLPQDTSHLVLSVGGNDALGWLPTLDRPTRSLLEALGHLHTIQAEFQGHYDRLLTQLKSAEKPTLVCTVYDAVPGLTPPLKTALSLFNDVITRGALRHRFDILELRELLNEAGDYSAVSPIEPSAQGGAKISAAIVRWVKRTA